MMNSLVSLATVNCRKRRGEGLLVHRVLVWTISLLAVVVIVLATQITSAHADPAYPEEAVEAIFLYRFAGYVTWPASMSNGPQFTIAVLGAENVAEQLRGFLPQHPIQGRPAHVVAIQGLAQLGDAQMLYIGPGVSGRLSVLIEALKNKPILIVTDQPGGLEQGSTVNFLIEQQHVRFEISTIAAKRSGLQIASGLLAVAERVKTSNLRGSSACRPFGEDDSPCPLPLARQLSDPSYRKGG